jgi:hypothetical protein
MARAIVTINGKDYDAMTGAPLGRHIERKAPTSKKSAEKVSVATEKSSPATDDKKKQSASTDAKIPAKKPPKPRKTTAKKTAKSVPKRPKKIGLETVAPHGVRVSKKPGRSTTLNRRVVARRAVDKTAADDRHESRAASEPSIRRVTAATTNRAVPDIRKIHNSDFVAVPPKPIIIETSPLVSHFSDVKPSASTRLEFKDSPSANKKPFVSRPIETPDNLISNFTTKPTDSEVFESLAYDFGTDIPEKKAKKEKHSETIEVTEETADDDKIDELLEEAAAPKEIKSREHHSHKMLVVIIVALVVVLGGAVTSLVYLPNIEMAIASHSAGIKMKIPSYAAPGYKLKNPVTYSSNEVRITYENTRIGASYTISASAADGKDAPVATNGQSSTFTKNGVRYKIDFTALTDEQVGRIADSL